MRKITLTVYKYEELSEKAKEKARVQFIVANANEKLEELMGGTEIFLTYKYGVESVDCSYTMQDGPKITCYVRERALEKILYAQNKVGLWKSYKDLRKIGLPEFVIGVRADGIETRVDTRTEKKAPTMAVLKYAQILEEQIRTVLGVWHKEEVAKLRKEMEEYIPTREEVEKIIHTQEYSKEGEKFYPHTIAYFTHSPL